MISIGLLGHKGRMGKSVVEILNTELQKSARLAATADAGDEAAALLKTDVVIDFSSAAGMAALAKLALSATAPLPAFVIASTGWKLDDRAALEELAKKTPVLMSSNFSMGVLALMEILKTAGPRLEALGYRPVIVETHHKHKKDAPSGTALSLQRVLAPAGPGNIPTHSIRGGEVIGEHEVRFLGAGDRLTLSHHADDRSIFARGALEAAIWVAGKRAAYQPRGLIGIEAFFESSKSGESGKKANP